MVHEKLCDTILFCSVTNFVSVIWFFFVEGGSRTNDSNLWRDYSSVHFHKSATTKFSMKRYLSREFRWRNFAILTIIHLWTHSKHWVQGQLFFMGESLNKDYLLAFKYWTKTFFSPHFNSLKAFGILNSAQGVASQPLLQQKMTCMPQISMSALPIYKKMWGWTCFSES